MMVLIEIFDPNLAVEYVLSFVRNGLQPYVVDRVGTQTFNYVEELLLKLVAIETNRHNIGRLQRKLKAGKMTKQKLNADRNTERMCARHHNLFLLL